MLRLPLLLLTAALIGVMGVMGTGCAKQKDLVDAPPWASEEGKQETRLGIADRMLDLGYAEEAMTLLKIARDEGEEGPEIDRLTGHALYLKGMKGEARALLEEVSEQDKRNPEVWRVLGLVYADSEMPDEAIAAFQRASELDDADAATWNNLGFLLYTVKRSPDAVPALRKAVSLDGTNARYRRNLGFALFNNGDVDGAIDAFRASGPLGDAWYNLGVAYALAGDTETARARYERALEHDPDHVRAREALALLSTEESP